MFTTDPEHRKNYIDGLRQLADYLESHAGIAVPKYGTTIPVSLPDVEDGGREEVRHAYCCGLDGEYRTTDNGTVETSWQFGPVIYKVYAMAREAIIRHEAGMSYYRSVSPDD